ncbi:MAG: cell division protein CrgA [Aeromicrobium sp.]|uniref:cell division protein CrgA n=1 Tax=Aeromicrobium sp. TaxID=1871063 RepID=UPI0039E36E04
MSTKPSSTPRFRGGWWHPAAIVLGVLGAGWLVAWLFYTIETNLPGPHIPQFVTDLGNWNWAIAAVLLLAGSWVASGTRPEPAPGASLGWRYAPHLMIASALIGLLWIVTFYTISNTEVDLPVITDLGNWNLVVGMGFIVAAFGFATKWE